MKGETAIELDIFVWGGAFALGVLGLRFGLGWLWWFAIPVGIAVGFVLYVPLWLVVIYTLRMFGLIKPERSENVRRPHNLGERPERRG